MKKCNHKKDYYTWHMVIFFSCSSIFLLLWLLLLMRGYDFFSIANFFPHIHIFYSCSIFSFLIFFWLLLLGERILSLHHNFLIYVHALDNYNIRQFCSYSLTFFITSSLFCIATIYSSNQKYPLCMHIPFHKKIE